MSTLRSSFLWIAQRWYFEAVDECFHNYTPQAFLHSDLCSWEITTSKHLSGQITWLITASRRAVTGGYTGAAAALVPLILSQIQFSSGRVTGEAIRELLPPAAGLLLFWLKQTHTADETALFSADFVSRGTSATQAATEAQRQECCRQRGQPVATAGIELSLCVMSPMKHHSAFE